jgi:methylated-DNA-[protein]-cysteine S-methyltransferase
VQPSHVGGPASHAVFRSVLGDLTVVGRSGALTGLYFPGHWYRPDRRSFGVQVPDGFAEARRQLTAYLAGEQRQFELPMAVEGTDLQLRVWHLVSQVPYGQTWTYGELARQLNDGTTPQEVGAAVGRNPLCILIPCHRILSSTGKLTGYAGGLGRKRFLLDLERGQAALPES